jgi:hypothetical protein|tara:strand:+ start:7523 stop:7960 length:438 start_codon:yes stop_codon:yes gene_type:complete
LTNNKRGLLLASFLTTGSEDKVLEEVQFIADNLDLSNNFIFLLRNTEDFDKKILTYNAHVEKGKSFNPNLYTTRVHRKKQTNTLYTINALNLAIAKQHDGKTGRDLKLDWEEYRNCLLLSQGKKLNVHTVEVVKIFKLEDEPEEN